MKLVRAWPTNPPARPHVIDDAMRVAVDDYDYSGLADVGDDVISLDWDIAVSREDLAVFAALARRAPRRVLVAPYLIYPDSRRGMQAPTWAAKRYINAGGQTRYVDEGETHCHLFGFGMVYLPHELLRGFVDTFAGRLADGSMVMDDISFSGWHYRNVDQEAELAWQVRPAHLHYDIAATPL